MDQAANLIADCQSLRYFCKGSGPASTFSISPTCWGGLFRCAATWNRFPNPIVPWLKIDMEVHTSKIQWLNFQNPGVHAIIVMHRFSATSWIGVLVEFHPWNRKAEIWSTHCSFKICGCVACCKALRQKERGLDFFYLQYLGNGVYCWKQCSIRPHSDFLLWPISKCSFFFFVPALPGKTHVLPLNWSKQQ